MIVAWLKEFGGRGSGGDARRYFKEMTSRFYIHSVILFIKNGPYTNVTLNTIISIFYHYAMAFICTSFRPELH